MDELIKDYKFTKQIMIRKIQIKENFCKEKENFLKEYKIENENRIDQKIYNQITSSVSNSLNFSNIIYTIPNPITDFAGNFSNKIKNTLYSQININININTDENKIKGNENKSDTNNIANLNNDNKIKKLNTIGKLIENKNKNYYINENYKKNNSDLNNNFNNNSNTDYNHYEDSSQVLNLIKKNDTKDLDKTKQILFGLSDLMTNFSMKVLQHHEMTETSIHIIKLII